LGNNNHLYIDNELFRWNDWNLCTALEEENKIDKQKYLQIITKTPDKKAVPLRFGWSYSFALRPVDICGNSMISIDKRDELWSALGLFLAPGIYKPPPERPATSESLLTIHKYFTPPVEYLRVDGIHAPRIFYADYNQRNWTTGPQAREDEHLTTLVIRSICNEEGTKLLAEKDQDDIRLLSPPRVSLNFFIQHGIIDGLINDGKGAIPERTLDSLYEMDHIEKQEDETKAEVKRLAKNDKIDFLCDPLVDGYVLHINDKPYSRSLNYSQLNQNYHWENLPYHSIRLSALKKPVQPLPDQKVSLELYPDETAVLLQAGCMRTVKLGCICSSEFKSKATEELFMPGIRKYQNIEIELIHAVEKPCLVNNTYPNRKIPDTNFLNNIPGTMPKPLTQWPLSTNCKLQINFDLFPVKTADNYLLHVQYIDCICDRASNDDGYKLEYINKVIKTNILPVTNEEENVFFEIEHQFDDTRFKKVNYRLEAVSKFRQYFDSTILNSSNSVFGYVSNNPKITDDSENLTTAENFIEGLFDKDKSINAVSFKAIQGANKYRQILNTVKPKELKIEKIVPILNWSENNNDKTVTRSCNKIRIYFEGDWYDTGYGEKVAVFFKSDSDEDKLSSDWPEKFSSRNTLRFKKGPDYKEQSLNNLISQFGNDPISIAEGIPESEIITGDFFKVLDPDVETGMVKIKYLDFEKPIYQGAADPSLNMLADVDLSFITRDIQYKSPNKLNTEAGLDITDENYKYDSRYTDKGKFYIDIVMDETRLKKYYFPFIRFALARYQPNSIKPEKDPDNKTYMFSKITMTDFFQPLPYRKIKIDGANITWCSENPVRQIPNEVVCFKEDPGMKELSDFEQENSKKPLATLNPGNSKTLNCLSGDQITIAEYESFSNDQLTKVEKGQLVEVKMNDNPRNELRKRLIFSYTFKMP
jgi:hypothetical protein